MTMQLICDGYRYEIEDDWLTITHSESEVMRLPLAPAVEGESLESGEWQQVSPDHFSTELAGFGSVHLSLREGYVCYWIETDRKYFSKLTYFPDSRPTETGWHTFVSDEMDRYWAVDENAEVPISSAYIDMHVDKGDGAGMTDPGDQPPTWIWNVPPRAAAVETPAGWLGLSIPGPLSVGVTRFTMRHGTFNITFEELRPTAQEWGPPRVYFLPGLENPYDTLDRHRIISERCGLVRKDHPTHPKWWTYPSFKCADEVFRQNDRRWIVRDEEGNIKTALTTENWLRWIDHVENYTGLKGRMNLQVDQLFFHGYGGRKVIDSMGGAEGMRRTIDQLRERGMHVGLYIHLYMLDPTATDFPARHPEAVCKPKDPATVVQHGVPVGSQDMVYVDWTHPSGRQYMLDHVEWLLSDRPGCLNADWLLINNNLAADPRKFEFHDPDWGTGDLMTMKALKVVYEHAKEIKPDCYVRRQSPGDPYMQPYFDQANLCEEWNGQTTAWYRRLHLATRVLADCILHTDAWFVTMTKLTEYYFALAAVCQPEIESVEHAIHPYISWREMRPKDYRRIRAGVQVYMNAPIRRHDVCRVNFKGMNSLEIWRRHSSGPLAGWYAALALHRRCFVTYSENEARVAASQERRVTIPLPPTSRLLAVEAVPHEGDPFPYPHEQIQEGGRPAVRLWAPDAGEDLMYVRLNYELR